MSTFISFIQNSTGSPSHNKQTKRRNKRHSNWKEVKLSLFADYTILYKDNHKDSTKKILKLINEFSKVAEYKINIQKSVAFLHASNEGSEREPKRTMAFTIASNT